jgi:hypothetical protein
MQLTDFTAESLAAAIEEQNRWLAEEERRELAVDHIKAIDQQTAAFVQARMMGRPVSFRYVDGTHETFNA